MGIETKQELEQFYNREDPWQYEQCPDDVLRRERLMSLLPRREFQRTLDIGCGNGYITERLPGERVIGVDLAENAVAWARRRVASLADKERFKFIACSLFDLPRHVEGPFDLIVITGILYPQYVGGSFSVVQCIVDDLLPAGGIIVSCHIDDWCKFRFPYTLVDGTAYTYRSYTHRAEVMIK